MLNKPCPTFLLFNKNQDFWWLNESFGALGGPTIVEKPRRYSTRMRKNMASGGSGPPNPPSGNPDKGKGKKKSYVVKLMTRFNNEIGSTSQPTTPTSTSTARSVPPPLVVPAFTPTPHQVPTSTPTSYQLPPHGMASLSPNIGSNPSTPTNIAPSPGTDDGNPHSSSAANYVEECSNSRPMITPVGGGFYPTKTASKAITATIKQQFDEPWLTWGSIPKSTRDVFFERFKRCALNTSSPEPKIQLHTENLTVSWKPEDEEKSQELGRSVHVDEIFQQTHIRQSTGEFVDERSRRTHEQFVAKFDQIRSETASVGVSASSPLDPAEEERLRNRCWLEAAGGRYKGRVYDIGNVSSQDDCVDSYIQQTQASSSGQQQNLEEIVNLKSQLQQYGQQLQKFEGFIGVLLPFLPPSAAAAAQDFLNLQNPQPQNEVPNDVQPEQQPPEQQPPHQQPTEEQAEDGNDYMHY
ncbi:hypothetical protein LR48_Vigan11g117900 [Vigna angularis]|uniref:Uncharacterized protein n=1 Tax=Phaseolus angularis TaxID=3914 RepID=A0A0L9VSV0_PHAAN|nr:hypothetical protein LR48_Vigan11g117900 [Vigna angularis]